MFLRNCFALKEVPFESVVSVVRRGEEKEKDKMEKSFACLLVFSQEQAAGDSNLGLEHESQALY